MRDNRALYIVLGLVLILMLGLITGVIGWGTPVPQPVIPPPPAQAPQAPRSP